MTEVRNIKIEDIIVPKERARATFTPEQYEELKASIRTNGFTVPILVRKKDNGKYELIDGEHRLMVAKELGYTEVPAVIIEADDKKATLLNVLANTARGTQNPMDVAEALKKALDAGATIEELAMATGHSERWVKLYLMLNELPDIYKQALREGKLKVCHIELALKLDDPVEIDAALQSALIHSWSCQVMKYYVEQRLEALERAKREGNLEVLERPPTPEEAQEIVQYGECMFCGRKFPRDQLRMPVMCEEDYQLLQWINEQIGPPERAKLIIYNAVNMYLDFIRQQQEMQQQQEYVKTTAQPPTPAPQQQNNNQESEDEKIIRIIKALKEAGVI